MGVIAQKEKVVFIEQRGLFEYLDNIFLCANTNPANSCPTKDRRNFRMEKRDKGNKLKPELENDIAKVDERNVRSVTFSGLPGVGKSQQALEYMAAREGSFDALFRISAYDKHGLTRGYNEICKALKLDRDIAKEETWKCSIDELRRKKVRSWFSNPQKRPISSEEGEAKWLLILDNAQDPEDLEKWLPANGRNGCLIITSRNPVFRESKWSASPAIDITPFTTKDGARYLREYLETKYTRLQRYYGPTSFSDALGNDYGGQTFREDCSDAVGGIPKALYEMFSPHDAVTAFTRSKIFLDNSRDLEERRRYYRQSSIWDGLAGLRQGFFSRFWGAKYTLLLNELSEAYPSSLAFEEARERCVGKYDLGYADFEDGKDDLIASSIIQEVAEPETFILRDTIKKLWAKLPVHKVEKAENFRKTQLRIDPIARQLYHCQDSQDRFDPLTLLRESIRHGSGGNRF
ncbi:hypothetical protein BDV96DRAFT_649511 [Lophiotrema nucula]|uniref:P-loop containing nucleoside triphosphate hydrolase protein n=1 Tax=Lophiotrema nucula TaxID=690887 RepID=A0A6A5YYC3_9PLEO|nr:hypothetical protein BDV96DRAFT_649511 [Lophiotrema nucula]